MSLLQGAIWLAIYWMYAAWAVHLVKRDVSVVDLFWGPGFVWIAWYAYFSSPSASLRSLIVAVLATIWGARLFIHLSIRSRGRGEDPRYTNIRNKYEPGFWWKSLGIIFALQAALMVVISLVLQATIVNPGPESLSFLDFLGIAIWATGLFFESVGDYQLFRFVRNPSNKGKVLASGLWAWTRHPNYFGESLIWWGFFVICINNFSNVWAIISPITITFLLLRVSGVTLLEEQMIKENPAYRDYVFKTSSFLPKPPKK